MKYKLLHLLAVAIVLTTHNSPAAPLLPFQGHLTAADGTALDGAAKVVQFKIYDAPVAGTAVWAGEIHKLSVNRGLVNTVLGTKTAFPARYAGDAKVMFSEPLYIEITVDSDDSNTITATDPPLLPRQILLPANFAHVAMSAETVKGVDLVDRQTSTLRPGVIADESIPSRAITSDNTISASQLATDSVDHLELAANSVRTQEIKDGEVRELSTG